MKSRASLQDYFNHSEAAFTVPDIKNGFIPQGIDYDAGSDQIIITGYMGGGSNSPIYAIGRTGGELKKKVLMLTPEGGNFSGHSGGLAVFGDSLYIAGSIDACIYSFPLADFADAGNNSKLPAAKKIELKTEQDYIRVSFTSRDESFLYAGEFHKSPIFYTHDSHKVEAGGKTQKAYLFGFTLDEDRNPIPSRVYSIPDSVQGAIFHDGYLYLSQSNGLLPGKILTYDLSGAEPSGTKNVLGSDIPLYVLSEKAASKVTVIPPMSEEITVVDDQLYILYESASNRYRIGRLFGLDKVYRTPIEYFR